MEIRLIAMDLDGTALQNDRCTFSPRLHDALHAAHRQGIAIVPITGRQYKLLPHVLQATQPWANLAVLCNGGQIRDMNTGTVLYSLAMPPESLKQLLTLAEKYCLPIEFSVDSTLYLTQASYDKQLPYPSLAFHRDTILAAHGQIVDSLEPLCHLEIEKVNLLCITNDIRDSVKQHLESIAVSAVWSSSSSMEITHPKATKGQGLQRICSVLNIPMSAVMALGDSGNDITMLQQAGLGVAMGNAPDFVKQAADVCTLRYDEDGAALAIEKYVLRAEGGKIE